MLQRLQRVCYSLLLVPDCCDVLCIQECTNTRNILHRRIPRQACGSHEVGKGMRGPASLLISLPCELQEEEVVVASGALGLSKEHSLVAR